MRGSTARRTRGFEVASAAPRVEHLARARVEEHRVHREVAAPRRLLDRHAGVALDTDAAVAGALLRVAPRQRDVERAVDARHAAQLEHAEGLADRVDTPVRVEDRLEAIGRQAEHLDVEVLQRPQQPVADRAADDERPAPGLVQGVETASRAGGRGRFTYARLPEKNGRPGRGFPQLDGPYLSTRMSSALVKGRGSWRIVVRGQPWAVAAAVACFLVRGLVPPPPRPPPGG